MATQKSSQSIIDIQNARYGLDQNIETSTQETSTQEEAPPIIKQQQSIIDIQNARYGLEPKTQTQQQEPSWLDKAGTYLKESVKKVPDLLSEGYDKASTSDFTGIKTKIGYPLPPVVPPTEKKPDMTVPENNPELKTFVEQQSKDVYGGKDPTDMGMSPLPMQYQNKKVVDFLNTPLLDKEKIDEKEKTAISEEVNRIRTRFKDEPDSFKKTMQLKEADDIESGKINLFRQPVIKFGGKAGEVQKGVKDFLENTGQELSKPANILTLGTMSKLNLFKYAWPYFGYQGAKDTKEAVQDFTKGNISGGTEKALNAVLNLAVAGGPAKKQIGGVLTKATRAYKDKFGYTPTKILDAETPPINKGPIPPQESDVINVSDTGYVGPTKLLKQGENVAVAQKSPVPTIGKIIEGEQTSQPVVSQESPIIYKTKYRAPKPKTNFGEGAAGEIIKQEVERPGSVPQAMFVTARITSRLNKELGLDIEGFDAAKMLGNDKLEFLNKSGLNGQQLLNKTDLLIDKYVKKQREKTLKLNAPENAPETPTVDKHGQTIDEQGMPVSVVKKPIPEQKMEKPNMMPQQSKVVKTYQEPVVGTKATKEQQQSFLVNSLNDAIKEAPEQTLEEFTGSGDRRVVFKVPGDGEFAVKYNMPELKSFKKLIEKKWPNPLSPMKKGPKYTKAREGVPAKRPEGFVGEYYNEYKPRVSKDVIEGGWQEASQSNRNLYINELGMYTEGHYGVAIPKSDIKVPLTSFEYNDGMKAIFSSDGSLPAKIIAEYYKKDISPDAENVGPYVHIATTDGFHHASFNPKFIDNILAYHPDSKVMLNVQTPEQPRAIFVSPKGKTVGVAMAMRGGEKTERPTSIDNINADPQRVLKMLEEKGILNKDTVKPEEATVTDSEAPQYGGLSGKESSGLYSREMPVSMEPSPDYKPKQKPVGSYEVVQEMSKIWEAPIGIGKFRQGVKGGVRTGVFYPKSGQVRIGVANDIPTATHEIAHWFDRSTPVKGFRRKYAKELGPLDYNIERGDTGEGFAEFIRHYLTNNPVAQEKAPTFYKAFNDFLDLNPKIKKNMTDTAALIKTFKDQGAVRRAEGMMGKMGEKGKESHLSLWKRIKLGWRTAMTDELAVLDHAVRDMSKGKMSPSRDPYKLALYSKGSGARARAFLLNESVDFAGLKTGESLKEVFNSVRKEDFQDFLTFSYARIAKERLGQNRNPGLSLKDAEYIFENMKDRPGFMDASTRLSDWYRRLLDYAFEPMFKDKAVYEKIKNSTAFYLPLRRIIDNSLGPSGSGTGTYMMPGEGIKRMSEKGSGRKVKNFVEQSVNMAENIVEIADKSRVIYALRDLGMSSPKGKWWIRKVDRPMEADTISLRKIKEALKKQFDYDLYDPNTDSIVGDISKDKLEELKGIAEAEEIPLKDLIREETSEALDVMATFFSNANFARKGSNLIAMPESSGKVSFYEMDPLLYRSLNGMNNIELHGWVKWLDAVPFAAKKSIVLGATGLKFSWAFINAMRDSMMSVVTSEKPGIGAIGRHFKGYGELLRDTPAYKQWRNTGGEMSNLVRENQRQLKTVYDELMTRSKKDVVRNVVKHPIEYLKSLLSVSETATRLGEFKLIKDAAEKKGYSPDDVAISAATGASDVSLNFKRMGAISKYLNRYIPYFNPYVQGKSKFYRTFTGPNKYKSMAAAFKYLTIPAIGLYLLSRKNDKMRDREWYERLTTLPVSFSDTGHLWKMPLPQDELGILFGSIPLAILESLDRQDPTILDGVAKQYVKQSMLPPKAPAVMLGGAEWVANKSFYRDRPLEPKWMDDPARGILPGYRTNEYTFDIIKDIGEATGIDPIKLQNFIQVQTGGLGTELIQAENVLKGNAKELADYPLVGRLVSRENKTGPVVDEYFEKMQKLQQIKNTADYEWKKNKYDNKRKKEIEEKYKFDLSEYYKMNTYRDMIIDAFKAKNYKQATDYARKALGKE
jgi:hypothetical protein